MVKKAVNPLPSETSFVKANPSTVKPRHGVNWDRLSLWVIGAIAFFAVGGGIFQIRSYLFTHDRVFAPLREQLRKLQEENVDLSFAEEQTTEELTKLTTADTDGDGMSDFEEIYIQSTSPYLADSDSDGITDSEEVNTGTNPNCPEGQTCAQERKTTTTTAAEEAFADLNPAELGIDASGEINPEELREQLKAYGVSEDVLAQTDDETLLKIFTETVAQTQGTNPLEIVESQAEAIRNLSVEEKRNLLIQSGVDAATANGLDETTINEIFDQVLSQAVTEVLEEQRTSEESEEETESQAGEESSRESEE